jgi:hypothetical protein
MNFLLIWKCNLFGRTDERFKFFETLEQTYAFINHTENLIKGIDKIELSFRIVSATSKTYERKQVRHGSDQVPTLQ